MKKIFKALRIDPSMGWILIVITFIFILGLISQVTFQVKKEIKLPPEDVSPLTEMEIPEEIPL